MGKRCLPRLRRNGYAEARRQFVPHTASDIQQGRNSPSSRVRGRLPSQRPSGTVLAAADAMDPGRGRTGLVMPSPREALHLGAVANAHEFLLTMVQYSTFRGLSTSQHSGREGFGEVPDQRLEHACPPEGLEVAVGHHLLGPIAHPRLW